MVVAVFVCWPVTTLLFLYLEPLFHYCPRSCVRLCSRAIRTEQCVCI